jgi:protein gp37
MSAQTGIEWTDRTWNPTVGCSVLSPGCKHCSAMRMAARIERMGVAPHYAGLTEITKAGPVWNGTVREAPAHIMMAPASWKKPSHIFVNSMSDLFHEGLSDETISFVFQVMAMAPQHIYQVLTKRSDRMKDWCSRYQPKPLPNVWLGVSVEDRLRTTRIYDLRETPAAVRFVSAEPLLEELRDVNLRAIDWVICGGETGKDFRSMNSNWARSLRDQCVAAGVAFFMKQMSGRDVIPNDLMIREFPKARVVEVA